MAEYQWLHEYTNNPQFWAEDVLSWDDSFSLALSDYSLFTLLTSSFFVKTYIYLDLFTKTSFVDILNISESVDFLDAQEFYNAVMWDLAEAIQVYFFSYQFIFYTNYQDFFSIVLYHSPELLLAIINFISTYVDSNTLAYLTSYGSRFFNDSVILATLKLANVLLLLCVWMWFWIIFFYILRLTTWGNTLESYSTRFTLYLYCASKENRIQFESALLTALLFTLLFVFNVVTFRDLYEESIESLTVFLFYLFLFTYVFFLYKNSVHYFSFLEASISDRRTVSLFIQFLKDSANSFVLLLRFLTLLFRLNIYDTVDDVLDSNYIFICDFEDDAYFTDLFSTFYQSIFVNGDYYGDRTLFYEHDLDFSFDLFSLYFILCGKFLSFIFFALEEVGRVLLAFFIVYLVIFEMQSVNRSHNELLLLGTRSIKN